MSNASSISSNGLDSMPGSYTGVNRGAEDPYSSAVSLGEQSDQGDSASSEPLFNFRSLAEVVGVSIDGDGGPADGSSQKHGGKLDDGAHGEHVEHIEHIEQATEPLTKEAGGGSDNASKTEGTDSTFSCIGARQGESPPNVVVTPDTPAPVDDDHGDSKQLGNFDSRERSREVTQ
ncbi:hypothetical protein O1611_g10534 [Lasiodiplodia mahajangana]|uniref:Uncharacterized protein n=1 Tax=Lasiodiplodia mahajangana TaxID=1108764 RepID=A0ACC2IX36_9PEZI|nr:hypothetical protein O1611_g10534 [Lasiodiplodia mahajangana]